MTNKRPLVLTSGSIVEKVDADTLIIAPNLLLDSSSLTTNRTVSFQDKAGILAFLSDIAVSNISITNSLSILKDTHAGMLLTISGNNTIVATLDTAVGFNSNILSFYQFNIDSSFSGSFSIATTSSQTINGSISPQQFYPGEVFKLYSDGSNWICH